MKVAICCPTRDRPHQAFLDSLEASIPLLDAKGYDHKATFQIGCPYISAARATMLRKSMIWGADVFIFLDDDVSWKPQDLIDLIEAEGDVVGGTYRFKSEEENVYMGFILTGPNGRPMCRPSDGAIEAHRLPAGFLKVTKAAIEKFMRDYPELIINADENGFESPDLFNHGVHKGIWYGEDYAFCRNWLDKGGELWLLPNLDLDHNGKDKVWRGNLHKRLLESPSNALKERL